MLNIPSDPGRANVRVRGALRLSGVLRVHGSLTLRLIKEPVTMDLVELLLPRPAGILKGA